MYVSLSLQNQAKAPSFFITRQLFAPHLSCLILSPSSPLCTLDIPSLGHYFHPRTPSYKLAPGGAPYELQAACAEVLPYLSALGRFSGETNDPQPALYRAFERIRAHERILSGRLLEYLLGDEAVERGVRVVGPQTVEQRAPTISFVVVEPVQGQEGGWRKRMMSRDVVKAFDETREIGIKYGHFYATRIMPLLPIQPSSSTTAPSPPLPASAIRDGHYVHENGSVWTPDVDGDAVVRISLVHYNTVEQVDRIVKVLRRALA